jgi:iron uptake system EfeUOB component EfeO/EfeM
METEYNGQIMSNYRQDNFLGYDIYQSLTAAEKAALMFTI